MKGKHGQEYNRMVRIHTSPDQDQRMKAYAAKHFNEPFNKLNNNCRPLAERIMTAGGLKGTNTLTPNGQFDVIKTRWEPGTRSLPQNIDGVPMRNDSHN
jgi:hypothetical protein